MGRPIAGLRSLPPMLVAAPPPSAYLRGPECWAQAPIMCLTPLPPQCWFQAPPNVGLHSRPRSAGLVPLSPTPSVGLRRPPS